ncbi:MAG: hypothetical protein Q7V88_14205 [Actinomycetota bacterium]|nr:hypothetical protein [Actinomycetota bacterium]
MIRREGVVHIWRRWRTHLPLAALLVFVAVVAVLLHRRGHTWGDDFTLYLRQARSLIDGNVGQIISDNHFNVDNAAKPGFSPYVYPWGFPLLLAPFLRLFGLDYGRLKLVEVAALCVFLWGFHQVLRRRMQQWLAFAVVASLGTTLAYLRHTDSLISELPYMAAVAVTLWWLDRLRRDQPLDAATRHQLIALGLMANLVFNIRREGVSIVAAIAVAQLLDLRGRWREIEWRSAQGWHVATPLVSFAVSVGLLQLMLPSALAPEYENAGLHQTWKKLGGPFRTAFAGQLGFSELRGLGLLLVFLVVAAGVLVRMRRAAADDAPLLVFAAGSMVVVGMIPANADRYMLAITPFAVYFAAQAIAAVRLPREAGPALATGVLAVVCLAHLTDLPSQVSAAQRFNDAGRVHDGPEAAYAQAAFTAVRTYTHQDDVVAFFKARALTFYTDRRAVQSSPLEIVRQRADYFMMRRDSTFSQPLVTDSEGAAMGWEIVWQDDNWVLWRLPVYGSG